MQALSLWQPHASAIALGLKKIETRGPNMRTGYRGLLAIHAAKKWTHEIAESTIELIRCGVKLPSPRGWGGARYSRTGKLERWLPLGAVVAVATLVDCRTMDQEWIGEQTQLELLLGGWEPGRHGWVLESVKALEEPLGLKGRQGLWALSADEVDQVLERVPTAGLTRTRQGEGGASPC